MNYAALLLLLVATIIASQSVHCQEVYRTVDENGKISFSDKPQKDSEQVDAEIKNVVDPVQIKARPSEKIPESPDYTIELNTPTDGESLGPTHNSLRISASASPRLQHDHFVELYLDGEKIVGPSKTSSTSVPLNLKMRGRHSAVAKVVDQDGKVLATSATVTFYVIRP